MFENIGLALNGVWSHKLRSFLTMLGIIIGIAAIITIVSTIKGTNEQIKNNLIGAGTNVVQVTLTQDGNYFDMSYSEPPEAVRVITEDVMEEVRALPGVNDATAYRSGPYSDGVYYKNNVYNGAVYGIDDHYFTTNHYALTEGRDFTEKDYSERRKVAIVDDSVAKSLFDGEDPIGKTLELMNEPFTVIGVTNQKTLTEPVINNLNDYYMYADSGSGMIFIPSVCWDIAYRFDEPQQVAVQAASTDEMAEAGTGVADFLTEQLISGNTYKYKADDILEQASNLQSLTQSANAQLIWIAGISLLVGGIGVMNIMLVSVTERTSEIGLKIAVGARGNRILWQFLTEAAVLTLMGGLLGVGAGIGLAYMLSNVMGTPVAISIPACIIAVAFSTVIGIVFGLVPAVKASHLNPIDALRHE